MDDSAPGAQPPPEPLPEQPPEQPTLVQALAGAEVAEEEASPDLTLAALAAAEGGPTSDPVDEERLAQRRQALAAVSGPRRSTFNFTLCLLLAGLGVSQTFFSLILESWALVTCGVVTLLFAYAAWRKTHWLQFNLRTALVSMVLVSLPFAWVGSQVRRYVQEEAATAELAEHWEADTARNYEHLPRWFRDWCPAGWLPVFGPVRTVTVRSSAFGDEQLPLLEPFVALEALDLRHTSVTDQGVERLPRFRQLQALVLEGTNVTHKALIPLRLLPVLARLNAVDTAITKEDAREFHRRYPRVQVATGKRPWTRNSRMVGVTPTSTPNVFEGVFEDLQPEIEKALQQPLNPGSGQPAEADPATVAPEDIE